VTASASAAATLPAASVPSSAAAATATSATAGSSLTANAASGETLDGLRGYRLAVASQARRFKRYPAEAKASGWTGSTEVRLDVGTEGLPRPATVSRSSGHEALDRAALAMIDAGAVRARLPDSLRGRNFTVTLPVVFNLDEE
jgi:protein TonB